MKHENIINVIVKVQLPLLTTSTDTEVLIYNKDRSISLIQVASQEVLNLFEKDEYKIFMKGIYYKNTETLTLTKRTKWRNW